MDLISNLPDELLLKIFRYLPYKHRFIVRRVNKIFLRISDVSISEISWIRLRPFPSENLTAFSDITFDAFTRLVDLCHKRLERIIFQIQGQEQWIDFFANYSCPLVSYMQIGHSIVKQDTFEKLFRNCPNLKYFYWAAVDNTPLMDRPLVYYPPDIGNSNLEILQLDFCDDVLLFSFLRRCPLLRNLAVGCLLGPATMTILDEFLAATPNLERINLHKQGEGRSADCSLRRMRHLWNLASLTHLVVNMQFNVPSDTMLLIKIASSFPNLELLWMVHMLVTNDCLEALTELNHLHSIAFRSDTVDVGLRRLAECGRLQQVCLLMGEISPMTLLSVLASSPRLRNLQVERVLTIADEEEAATLIGSVSATFKINARIKITCPVNREMWKRDKVQTALTALKEGAIGHDIKFTQV